MPLLVESGHMVYLCPMHAEARQEGPGKCPRCGMTLIPVMELPLAPDTTSREHQH